MNHQQSISGFLASAAHSYHKEITQPRAEYGRKAILAGCVITMIGMVTYCYGTAGGGPTDLASSLFDNGAIGWTSLLLMITGVGTWLAGNVALLSEANQAGK